MWFKKNKNHEQSNFLEDSMKQQSQQHNTLSEPILREIFKKNQDVQFISISFNHNIVKMIYCKGLVSTEFLNHIIPEKLESFFCKISEEVTEELIIHHLHFPNIDVVASEEKVISGIFEGKLFLDFGLNCIFSLDIAERPQRSPEETRSEVTILGPRDNFIEDITTNIALIRKRLRTTSLISESFEIGRRSQTKVSVLYMDDIANEDILMKIKEKLLAIDIDGLFSATQLEELINESPYALFPRHAYTGRPDHAVQSLLNGRFIILIDGVANAYITPINMFFLLKSSEDKEYNYLYNSFERLMRILGLSISTFLPGFWVALTSFHQNQIPLTFLATVVESRRGVPLPTSLEAILMLVLFELFREAGIRLPTTVGQTLSVIGGLIIGDAAIRAGLTSPSMLVVIAGSTIATFTLGHQSLIGTIVIIRFFVIILVSLFGFFGFFVSIFLIGIYLSKIRTFGVPYLDIMTRPNIRNILKNLLRLPEQKKVTRPNTLNTNDSTSKKGDSE